MVPKAFGTIVYNVNVAISDSHNIDITILHAFYVVKFFHLLS